MPWVSSTDFCALTGLSAQRFRQLCSEVVEGKRTEWKGKPLKVRIIDGRGGNSGQSYAVKLSTLPDHLQDRWRASQNALELPSRQSWPDQPSAREHLWWRALLEPVLQHPKGSKARRTAIEELASQRHFDWNGKPRKVSVAALRRRIAKEEQGVKLSRHARGDKGRKRVLVSREWDKAVPFDDATKEKIAEDLRQEIRGLFKGGAKWGIASMLARQFLVTVTKAHGYRPSDQDALQKLCSIPKRLLSQEIHFRTVHQFKRDRKAYEDGRPRISRTVAGLRPMEIVVADVHPVDVHLLRSDGSLATARLLAFEDWATGRVWCELVQLQGSGGIRNVDLIEAFAAMAEHPAFGLPEYLYIDNGKEYLFADFLDDAMRLNVQSFSSTDLSRSTVIRSQPYNPQAKVAEPFFGRFEGSHLGLLPGWIGGDRMNKRQEAVGRTVAPFGTFEEFVPAFFGLLRAYEHMPQEGKRLNGKSPAMAFKEHVDAGWRATVMSRDEIRAACARTETRTVRQGRISVNNIHWTCPELWEYPHSRVQVRVPAYHEPAELLLLDLKGQRLGIASPDKEFHPLDAGGAREVATRAKARKGMVRHLDKAAPRIDVAERLVTYGEQHADVVPNSPDGTVTFDPTMRPPRMSPPLKIAHQSDDERRREEEEDRAAFQAFARSRKASA